MNSPSLPPPLWFSPSLLCTALTHYSPVCFIPCLADGPEISPEQEEGAVPTYPSRPPHRPSTASLSLLCFALLSLSVSVCVNHCPILCVLFSVLSLWWIVGIFLNPATAALYCWRWCSLFRSHPRVSSPLAIFSFHIRHFVPSIIWNAVVFAKLVLTACDGRDPVCWMQETAVTFLTLWGFVVVFSVFLSLLMILYL